MEVTMFRHTSVAVRQGTCYGRADVPVSENFESEADEVKRQLEGEVFDVVYSSPLTRCRKLAAWCGYENPVIDERLLEIDCGEWEMKFWEDIDQEWLERWFADWMNYPVGGGESFKEQVARVSNFFDELKTKPYKRVCIFAHGGVIRSTLLYMGELEPTGAFTPEFPYCHKIVINI